MQIREINPKIHKTFDEVNATIISIAPVRFIYKCGKCGEKGVKDSELTECPKCKSTVTEKGGLWVQKVTDATIEDESGQCIMSLWKEQIDRVEVGDNIQITNGYVSTFNNKMQISTGKFGSLKVKE